MISKNKNFILFSLVTICLSFIFTFYLWDKIKLNYVNENEIIGHYSILSHHVLNDTLRFIFFVGFPLLIYSLLAIIFFKKKIFNELRNIFFLEDANVETKSLRLKILNIFFLIFLTILFLSTDLPINKLDIFHEGQFLSGGFNYTIKKSLWSEIHVSTGLFVDILFAPISWSIFGSESIGSFRALVLIVNIITHFSLIYLFYIFLQKIRGNETLKLLLLTFIFIFSNYLFESHYLNFRDLPLIFGLVLIFKLVIKNKKNYLNIFILSFICLISLFVSLEKGIYINLVCIFLLLYFLINKNYKNLFLFSTYLLIFWLIFYFIVGSNEFTAFVENSLSVINTSEYTNGQIYPHPFTDQPNSARGTKNLILIIINGIITLSILFFKNKLINNKIKIFLFLFFVGSLIFYKTALSHSDSAHLKQGVAFTYILFSLYLIIFLSYFLSKFFYDAKLKYRNLIFLVCLLIAIISSFNKINLNNVFIFKNNFINYINLNDSNFLSEQDNTFVNRLDKTLSDMSCLQLLNYDTALYYLLKKKSCTKYFIITDIGTKSQQNYLINNLKKQELKYLITGGPFDNWYVLPEERFPYIFQYLKLNYKFFEELNSRKILIKE